MNLFGLPRQSCKAFEKNHNLRKNEHLNNLNSAHIEPELSSGDLIFGVFKLSLSLRAATVPSLTSCDIAFTT